MKSEKIKQFPKQLPKPDFIGAINTSGLDKMKVPRLQEILDILKDVR